MPEKFAHLHLHTDRSMLDGVGRSSEYAELAAGAGHAALAITDHGNLYGLPEHRRACGKVGIKPVYGCELYINEDRLRSSGQSKQEAEGVDPTFADAHLVALCLDNAGWKNLLKINHDSVVNGYYYRPRTDTDFVLSHSEGLAVTTACLGSQFGRLAASGDVKRLREILGRYKDAFGDRFFVEVHLNELELQRRVNAVLLREASAMKITPILTSDVHYACAGDAHLQDEMIAIARHTPVNDPKAFKLEGRHLYYTSVEEAVRLARDLKTGLDPKFIRRAAANAFELADRASADIYPKGGGLSPPRYIAENGKPVADPFRTLEDLAVAGSEDRFKKVFDRDRRYYDRLRFELETIKKCGMSDFYLVTADVTREARRRGIFSWTRGSGCASLVAACIGITSVDPIRFGLLFERFVDPSRPNAPDFDIDIDSTRRPEIIDWLTRKYGGESGERIARISALSTFGLKAAIRDVCFAVGGDSRAAYAVSDAVDELPASVEASLADATPSERVAAIENAEAEFRKVLTPEVADNFFVKNKGVAVDALSMVGRVRGRTQHAAGYVVAPGPLVDYLPVDRIGSGEKAAIVSAWGEGLAMQDIGETGLMKIDLLGLEACTVISHAASMVMERAEVNIFDEIDGLGMNFSDEKVRAEYAKGDGVGLHQLATQDRKLAGIVSRLRPKSVAEVAAAISLYRPGSMAHVDEFVRRARGENPVPKVHPIVDEVLRETYGIAVYQEQVMILLHRLGRVPLRKAYEVIKAISKKRLDKIQSAREEFIKGASASGLAVSEAERIFGDIENFAGYGFNKAHAVSYAILSWITAYLRAYHPTEFWCSLLNSTPNEAPAKHKKDAIRKVEVVMRAAKKSGLTLLPPDVTSSSSAWAVVGPSKLLAPLSIIPGVGDAAAEMIAEAAGSSKWGTLSKFLAWAEKNKKAANSRVVCALANGGAFRSLGVCLTKAHDVAKVYQSAPSGSRLKHVEAAARAGSLLKTKRDPEIEMSIERSAIGFNFWHSPWSVNGRSEKIARLRELHKIPDAGDRVSFGKRYPFLLSAIRKHVDKKGNEMAFLSLESPEGDPVKGLCFSSVWKSIGDRPLVGRVYLISGKYGNDRTDFIVEKSGTSFSPFRSIDAMHA